MENTNQLQLLGDCPRCGAGAFNGVHCYDCNTDRTTPYAVRMNRAVARRREQNETECELFGCVVFFDVWRNEYTGERRLEETGRTVTGPYHIALNTYANVPNPASQLLIFRDDAEFKEVSDELAENVKDPEWLTELFNCI